MEFVSGRFLSDFFSQLTKEGIPVVDLLGDLPIAVDERGVVQRPVEWSHFADLMQRLERHLDGPEGLERCGALIVRMKPASFLRALAGLTASPLRLYRAASHWALRRAMPGVLTRIREIDATQIEIHASIAEGLRPCPQLFHFATGASRVLPRVIGGRDAVVSAEIGEREARFRIAVPPSRTFSARVRRLARAIFSSSSVLQFMEAQQLELHAKHDELERANAALAESERRYRAITDAAVDVLCEIDAAGRVVYVSGSVQDLMGYSPEQVTGSHFRLWIPSKYHELANSRFAAIASKPPGRSITQELVTLHAANGHRIVAEISVRSYRTFEGDWRMVGILRDVTRHFVPDESRRPPRGAPRRAPSGNDIAGLHAALGRLRNPDLETPHPLATSLARLLAALERATPGVDDATGPSDEAALLDATRRMTELLEGAIAPEPDPAVKAGWVDLRELASSVRAEFEAARDGAAPPLEIDLDGAPPRVWGRPALLAAGLGSLLDWAATLSGADDRPGVVPPRLVLEITQRASTTGAARVLECAMTMPSPFASGDPEAAERLEARLDLALAVVQDAITALDAQLAIEPGIAGGPFRARMTVPQPELED